MNKKLNLPQGCDLVFVDIEATDKHDRKMIQFSGLRQNTNGTSSELDIIINPKQPLSNYIINLLKIDDENLKGLPTIQDVEEQIIDFTKDALLVTFGEWDFPFLKSQLLKSLQTLHFDNLDHFDLQKYLKQFCSMQLPLLQFFNFINDDNKKNNFQHYAMFDAKILKFVFEYTQKLSDEQIRDIIPYIYAMPRKMLPCHKIFSKQEINNKWTNKPNSTYSPFIIEKININSFVKKENKQKNDINYLIYFEGYFWNNPNKKFKYSNPYKEINGPFIYEEYLQDCNWFINNFLNSVKNSGIIFTCINKDKIQAFLEIIYDATKKYVELNFINLSCIARLNKTQNPVNIFFDMIKTLPKIKKEKFLGYYYENN